MIEIDGMEPVLRLNLGEGKPRPIIVDRTSVVEAKRKVTNVRSSSFGANELVVYQPSAQHAAEFSVAIAYGTEIVSGVHHYETAADHDFTIKAFKVDEEGVHVESPAVDLPGQPFEVGEFASDRWGLEPAADRRLVLPLGAGRLTVQLSRVPWFPVN